MSVIFIVCIGVSIPLKNTASLFLAISNLQTVQAPVFRQSPPLYWFFVNLPLKLGFFSEPPKCYSFASLTPSYLLEVTKFLVKISQFEFLVMTEQNIFLYKLFFLIKYFRFQFIFYVNIAPPLKKSPPFFPATPSKVEVLSSPPPFLQFWLEVQPCPPAERGGGMQHTMNNIV